MALRFRNKRFLGPVAQKDWMRTAAAVRTWQTVWNTFFSPFAVLGLGEKEFGKFGENQMAFKGAIISDLEVTESQFGLFLLEALFDPVPGETDGKKGFQRSVEGGIGDEIFAFDRREDVLGEDQMPDQEPGASPQVQEGMFCLPDHGPLVGVFNVIGFPGLSEEGRRMSQEVPEILWVPGGSAGWVERSGERAGDFGDIALVLIVEIEEKLLGFSIIFVKRQPVEMQAIRLGPIDQIESNLPLGLEDFVVGNPGLPAAFAVVGPFPGQIEFTVEQTVEVGGEVAQMDGDDAVFDLSQPVAPLPGHPGRLDALFGVSGIVDQTEGQFPGMFLGNPSLDAAKDLLFVPFQERQKFLEGSRGNPGGLGDGLDALAGQIGHLPGQIGIKMPKQGRFPQTGPEPFQELFEQGFEQFYILGFHDITPPKAHLGLFNYTRVN